MPESLFHLITMVLALGDLIERMVPFLFNVAAFVVVLLVVPPDGLLPEDGFVVPLDGLSPEDGLSVVPLDGLSPEEESIRSL